MSQFVADENIIERNKKLINRDDVQKYIALLSYRRPSAQVFHKSYQEFLNKFIVPDFGKPDKHGNYIKIINDADGNHPRIAYMAHHDTVHGQVGRQIENIKYLPDAQGDVYVYISNTDVPRIRRTQTFKVKDKNGKETHEDREYVSIDTNCDSYSCCLGADCTTGVWLILQMIEAGCPGVYVIHEDEEIGCIGSGCIVDEYKRLTDEEKEEHWISKVDIAMSFDRYGEESIITYQSSSRTASDEFAESLGDITKEFFKENGYLQLKADDGGSYTDSNEYSDVISECTNISVGYYNQHGTSEKQNIDYLVMLRDCLVKHANDLNDPKKLIASRDPKEVDYLYGNYGYGSYGGGYGYSYRPNHGSSYNRRDNSYTFGADDPYDPYYYNDNPNHDEMNDYLGNDMRLMTNSTEASHGLSLDDIENIEYEFEDYVQETVNCNDIFDTGREEEIEEISELLRLFPYISASLLSQNMISSKEFLSRLKGEAVRRERLLSYEKLFRKDKETVIDNEIEF